MATAALTSHHGPSSRLTPKWQAATYLPGCMGRVWQGVWIGAGTCVGSNTANMKHITPRHHQCPLHSVFAVHIFSNACKAVRGGCANEQQTEIVEKYRAGLEKRTRRMKAASLKKAAEQKKAFALLGQAGCTSCGAVVSGSKQPWMCGSARCQSLTPPHALSALLIS